MTDKELTCSGCGEYAGSHISDRIEALTDRIEALTNLNEALVELMDDGDSKLVKAAGVIEWALICWDDHNKHGYNMQGDWVFDARATLAEIKGESRD